MNAETSEQPLVCVGLMTYQERDYACETLRSLLAQTYGNLRILVSDDGSTDGTREALLELAAGHRNVEVLEARPRRGMLANYARLLEAAPREATYFAWAAGHDRYEPSWAERLVEQLEAVPGSAIAYCDSGEIDGAGERVSKEKLRVSRLLDTRGCSQSARVLAVARTTDYGRKIYGLMRLSILRRLGPLPSLLYPDVLFLMRLSFYGDFLQCREALYLRRQTKAGISLREIVRRQRRNLFERPRWYHYLPFSLVNASYLAFCPLPGRPAPVPGLLSLRLGFAYSRRVFGGVLHRSLPRESGQRLRRRWFRSLKDLSLGLHRWRKTARARLRKWRKERDKRARKRAKARRG